MSARVALQSLDELWFQVAGTLCNLACTHCFISCSPQNHRLGHLTFAEVERALADSVLYGVREYYFTGGEPFLNREIVPILSRALEYGPTTVLTNATFLQPRWIEALRRAEVQSLYTLEFRVSLDAATAAEHDQIRGPGAFEMAMQGVELLAACDFLPIITLTRIWDDGDDARVLGELTHHLKQRGYARPRIKILPRLQRGAEAQRTHGYLPEERVTAEMLEGYDLARLLCSHSRIVTSEGVAVCPILVDAPDARLGAHLADGWSDYTLAHGACTTCYQYGAICTNPSGQR